jgi:hypothetical protein
MVTEYWQNNQINFFSKKKMFLLMPQESYMANNKVFRAGVWSLGGSPTNTLRGSGLSIYYS